MDDGKPDARGGVLLRGLVLVLALGVAGGLLPGMYRAGVWLFRGYAAAAPELLAGAVNQALPAAAVFVVLLLVLLRFLPGARPGGRGRVFLATALAMAPICAFVGYRINYVEAISPGNMLRGPGLSLNLKLIGGMAVVWIVLSFLVAAWTRRESPGSWRTFIALGAVVLLLNGVAFVLRPSAEKRPPVIFILVDALRADRLGCYGNERDTSPNIDALAKDSVRYETAISQSTFTKASIASLFTGRYPHHHGVYRGNLRDEADRFITDVLSEEEITVAEALRDDGYLTRALVQNLQLRARSGFGQGFFEYRDNAGTVRKINRRFLSFASRLGRLPFFAYLHYLDLHDPYEPMPPWDRKFGHYGEITSLDFDHWGRCLADIRAGKVVPTDSEVKQLLALYDGQIAYIDHMVGRLLDQLRDSGLYDRAMIIVTADHGDGFMEHGFISHSTSPYEELIHVPLIVKLPGSARAGTTVDTPVELIDLMPTIIALTGGAPVEGIDGEVLPGLGLSGPGLSGPGLAGPGRADADRSGDVTITEFDSDKGVPSVAVRGVRWKLLRIGKDREALYDLENDPGEHENLIATEADRAAPLRRVAERVAEARKSLEERRIALEEKTVDGLRGLGYVR